MFIGICGSICAGKATIAKYLVAHHRFTHLHIEPLPFAADTSESRPSDRKSFSTPHDMLDFVTKNWRGNWLTTDINSEAVLDTFVRRPFFLLISVDAPLTTRWRRYRQRAKDAGDATISVDEFAHRSDAQLYSPETGQLPLLHRATVHLLNTQEDVEQLHAALAHVNLLDVDRLRPCWDTYFMALASLAARRSNCMKRRVGCVVVRDRRVLSTGYNGTARGMVNCGAGGCGPCNSGQASGGASCLCLHAEENALLEAGRERLGDGAVLYCDTCPCLTCSIKIVQIGVTEVVYSQSYSMDTESAGVFGAAGVRLRRFQPRPDGMINLEKLDLSTKLNGLEISSGNDHAAKCPIR